ncbi:MAG TPA: carbohydrate kinase family protein [Candidatus Saccharibacteria bacterium]|nr:carbohydrate kinase family protein [Candidatus Saccharibacteria bacterium]
MVRICALGAASQDVFLSGSDAVSGRDPKTGEVTESFPLGAKVDVEEAVFNTGGGATNAAVTFARQGLRSSFIGKIGNDMAGHAVIEELDNENIDTRQVIYDKTRGTQYSTVILSDSGERTILIYRGVANTHTPSDYENIDFSDYDWLYVSSFAGAMDALDTVFTNAKKHDVKIAFNPGEGELDQIDKLKPLLEDVDILIVNKQEAQQIVEGTTTEELARHGLNYVSIMVVSDGPNGVVATDGKTVVTAGMYEDVPVIDRTGAGDAFGSGFLSQIAQGRSLKDSVVFASANSTSVVSAIGAKTKILYRGAELHAMPLSEKPF